MHSLRLASFGVQGSIGDGLTPEIVMDFAAAFGTFLEGRPVLIGRDTRQSSRMLHSAVLAGLMSTGCNVIDLAVCPTPVLQFSTPRFSAGGAVAISGGHSPMGCNALQLIGAQGAYIEPIVGETVLDIYHAQDFLQAPWNQVGHVTRATQYMEPYFEKLAQTINTDAIRAARFTVVIDPVNGAGCRFLQPFADCLGLRLLPINDVEAGHRIGQRIRGNGPFHIA